MNDYVVVIGYDRNNRMPAYTMAESIMQNSSVPVTFKFLHRDMLKMFTRKRSVHDSTDFSVSRFLTPYLCNYEGWALFTDNDMIVEGDIKEVFDLRDDRYTVLCTQHNQVCKDKTKFFGSEQHQYKYKNWTSVMLYNNSKCRVLTPDYVNTANGLDLHQFKWINSHEDEIGSIPLEWNYLVDNENQTDKQPKLYHWTDGGPYFKETVDVSFAEKWTSIYERINDVYNYKG